MLNLKSKNIRDTSDLLLISDFKFDKFGDCEGNPRSWSDVLKDIKSLKSKSGVYFIINKISGKKYIGSSRDLYRRFRSHFSLYFSEGESRYKLKKVLHMNSDLKKHGVCNFSFLVFFSENYVKDESFLFSLQDFEYNNRQPPKHIGKVYSINKFGDCKEFFCIEEASIYYKISKRQIQRILNEKIVVSPWGKLKLIFSSVVRNDSYIKDCFIKIISEDSSGNYLKSFVSPEEVSIYYSISKRTVYRSLKSGNLVKKLGVKFIWF